MLRILFATIFSLCMTTAIAQKTQHPKLILQITVDQLRGDLPFKYLDQFDQGGFRYLIEEGIVYRDAHHNHSNTETIVGHATLATGAYPSAHGLVGNIWYDKKSGRQVYNIEDGRYPLLNAYADVDQSTEIDPTQRVARSDGRSPAAIAVSTFSDELAEYFNGESKIFGVSVKDRGAVSLAGHAGKAFWFSKAIGQFVTSRFYYKKYPEWVNDFNAEDPTRDYIDADWTLTGNPESYVHIESDDNEWETSIPPFGRTFPHAYGPRDGKYFTTFLTLSPAGDEITLAFVKELVRNEGLGEDEITDYLSVSFSSTDYVGHIFGPSSLEQEDNLRRLDKTLANLISFIDNEVGLEETLIVLSADHGGPDAPPFLNQYGIEAKYVEPDSWNKEASLEALEEEFGIGEDLISNFFPPYLYLNDEAIDAAGADKSEVEEAVAREMAKFEGVHIAYSSTALMEGDIPDTELTRKILNNHYPGRSGDVFVVFEPHCFINDFDGLTVAATHGSPWNYDTYVPVIFAGMGLQGQHVYHKIETVDVARTLAAYIGTKPPSGSGGHVLKEVINH